MNPRSGNRITFQGVVANIGRVRQIDGARLAIGAHEFTGRFARALLDGTPDEFQVPTPKQRSRHVTPSEQSMMEQEADALPKHVDSIRASSGDDVRRPPECIFSEGSTPEAARPGSD